MFPLWFLLSLVTGVSDVAYNFVGRKYLRINGNPLVFAWWFSLVRTGIFGVLSFFLYNNLMPQTSVLLLLLALGIANAFNVYLFMRMHALTQLSLSAIVVQLRIVWVPLIALFLVGEVLSVYEYLGVALLFIAVFIIRSFKQLIIDKSVNTALVFSVTTSILTVLLKVVAQKAEIEHIIFFMSAPAVLILPLFLKDKGKLFLDWQKNLHQKILLTFFSIANLYLFITALALAGPVSKVNAIVQVLSVFAGATGIILLKERNDLGKKLLALGVAICGIALIV